jgi:hypothetical protein
MRLSQRRIAGGSGLFAQVVDHGQSVSEAASPIEIVRWNGAGSVRERTWSPRRTPPFSARYLHAEARSNTGELMCSRSERLGCCSGLGPRRPLTPGRRQDILEDGFRCGRRLRPEVLHEPGSELLVGR